MQSNGVVLRNVPFSKKESKCVRRANVRPENLLSAFGRKVAYADQAFGLQDTDDIAQVLVASSKQRRAFGGGQFIGRAIPSSALEKCERAIVHHKVFMEKLFCRAKPVREQSS